MRKVDPALFWMMGYATVYLILLKVLPITVGSLSLALLFALIIDIISSVISRIFRLGRGLSVALASVLFLGVIGFSIYNIFPIIFGEGKKILEFVNSFVRKPAGEIFPGLKEGSPALAFAKDVMDWLGTTFTKGFEDLAGFVLSKLPGITTGATLLMIASTYIALILPHMRGFVEHLFPRSTLDRTERFLRILHSNMKRFVGGQMVNALLVGLIVFVGMEIFGIRYAGFLGLLSGVTDFIPFLGAVITAIPAVFIGISQKGMMGLIQVGIVLIAANQIEGWILAPKVIGNSVKLNWFVVLITIIGLSELYGFIGVLISVPFLIVVREIWRYYVADILRKM